ncbi:hypothetical protein [Compostibacter hankyongensis]|uniref:Glycosyltransferase family 25 protein n=1 Tax=Compostibacter hankyongensis TaxID=1007089 RepID=A0ABP8FSG8_9BACT
MDVLQIIPTYIINLKDRKDRKKHIFKEFALKNEFNVKMIEPIKHGIGAISLWTTVKFILQDLVDDKDNYILICEDDHKFTHSYNMKFLFDNIKIAESLNADLLVGGVSSLTSLIQVSKNLYWVEKFSGLQFTIIFRKFFNHIFEADFDQTDAADYKMCSLTDHKFFIYPFISIQKDFGYSDATPKNNSKGCVKNLFKQSNEKVKLLKEVSSFYKKYKLEIGVTNDKSWDNIMIPTYVINLRADLKSHIQKQFEGRSEFDLMIIESCKHKIKTIELWLSIRKIIEMAIKNKDDVIIICDPTHEFTSHYTKRFLIQNIIEAHEQYADYLCGGINGFETALPIANSRFWINQILSTQFMIIYKKFFKRILNAPFHDDVISNLLLSELATNKMVIYPFISIQMRLGDSNQRFSNDKIMKTIERLEVIQKIYSIFGQ